MRLGTFTPSDAPTRPRSGALVGEYVVDLQFASIWMQDVHGGQSILLPGALPDLLSAGPNAWESARRVLEALGGEDILTLRSPADQPTAQPVAYRLESVTLYPPLPRPTSLRDFYAFEGHVLKAFDIRGREVPREWYEFPVFYYSNPNAIFGPGETVPYPVYTHSLDYELEVACVIGKSGINIQSSQAEEYIVGYTIMNDWSARDVQRNEMRVGLGPAKGKDFATSLGPWIVTPDELTQHAAGRPGVFDLKMTARVNGEERSCGNWKELHFSFGEMIARASAETYLYPGDVIGSGTVGTGCLLELTHGEGPWLHPGDQVELEVERLGVLVNKVAG